MKTRPIIDKMRKEIADFKRYLTGIIPMDNDIFDKIVPHLKIETLSKNDFFIKEGQVCRKVAFVQTGLFRVFFLKDGVEVNTCFCKENSITSSLKSIVDQTPSPESIQALEESVVVTISPEFCNRLSNENIQWQAVRQLFTERECIRLSDRANFLSFETALEKYKNLLRHQPELIKRVSIQHIASYMGVSRETISRIRAKIP